MPINRNTLLRYKTIDRMLRKGRRATLQELIDACSDALYEVNGYGDVSRRTIQHDIQEMRYSRDKSFHPQRYFSEMIGVSRWPDDKVEHIEFRVSASQVPYVTTKPFHQSQKEVSQMEDGSVIFSIDVILNFELERDILGFGEGITVISPDSLAGKIQKRLQKMLANYEKH